jgi:hypothetical protein
MGRDRCRIMFCETPRWRSGPVRSASGRERHSWSTAIVTRKVRCGSPPVPESPVGVLCDDLGLFTAEIMAEHEQTADTDLAWAAVTGIVDDLAAHG